jgi:TrmH family RNA methyltransferase
VDETLNIQVIGSKDNQYIRLAALLHQKKGREQEGLFLLEGKTLVQEALKKNLNIKFAFVTDTSTLSELDLPYDIQSFEVNEDLMGKIATTDTPPPIVAIAELPVFGDALKGVEQKNIFLYLENISDPGNLGSIIRTAFAAGVKSIYISPGSVDVFNPKALRSSMGTAFYGPIRYIGLPELIEKLKQHSSSLEILGTCPRAETNYSDMKFSAFKNILLLVGNESHGLSDSAKALCTQLVQIPLANDVESLNILAATSVVLFGLKNNK